jgi:hypothetical protein
VDEVTCFAVFATFSAIVLNRFKMFDEGIVDFVCGFVSFGVKESQGEEWVEVEEMWFLTVQVFHAVLCEKSDVGDRVVEGGWVGEWSELLKRDIGLWGFVNF